MRLSHSLSCGWPVKAYGLLLFAYPDRFRRAFGAGMLDVFERMAEEEGALEAWKAVGRELLPSLAREHAADAGDRLAEACSHAGALLFPLRVLLAVGVPTLAYAWLLRDAPRPEDVFAATLWFAAVGAGVARARGRGWASAGGAVAGGVAAAAVLVVYDAARGSPDILSVAPLLLATSGAAAFILATYVRVLVEGVQFSSSRTGAAIAA